MVLSRLHSGLRLSTDVLVAGASYGTASNSGATRRRNNSSCLTSSPSGPEEDPLHARARVPRQPLGADLRRPDRKRQGANDVRWAVQRRGQHVGDHLLGPARILGDVQPGGGQRVGELVGPPSGPSKQRGQRVQTDPEPFRTRVVRRGEPTVSGTRHPAQTGRRAPTGDPHRRTTWAHRRRFEHHTTRPVESAVDARTVTPQQPTQGRHRLVESPPPLAERHTHGGIVPRRRSRPDGHHQPSAGENIERDQRLRQRHRPAQHRKAHRGGQLHRSRLVDHRGQRGRAVQPWPAEQQMVVDAQEGVPERIRCQRSCNSPGWYGCWSRNSPPWLVT